MQLRFTFEEFKALALAELKRRQPTVTDALTFMTSYGSEPDGECHTLPDYVMVELEDKHEH